MGSLQTDIGRQGKVLIIGAAVALLAIGYIIATYQTAAATKQSSAVAIQPGHGTPSVESEHYNDVLNRYNKKNAATAEENGETYVSVLSSRSSAVGERGIADAPQQTPIQQAPVLESAPPAVLRPPQIDQRQNDRINEQAQALMVNWTATSHTESRSGEAGQPVRALATAPSPATAHPPTVNATPRKLVEDFEPIPAILKTDIDTDENSIVTAIIPSGEYADAKLFAMGYKRINNTVDMTFTSMKWKGNSYKINAKALDKDSLRSALSGEVNNRYFSRIIIPALALGLGRAGQLFEQADTQTIVTPFGTVVRSQSGPPSGKAVVGTILGGTAQQAGQVLTQDAAQVPVKQVLIARNETIGILFLEPVFSTTATPAPAPDPTSRPQ